jgi:hypothetical protein
LSLENFFFCDSRDLNSHRVVGINRASDEVAFAFADASFRGKAYTGRVAGIYP